MISLLSRSGSHYTPSLSPGFSSPPKNTSLGMLCSEWIPVLALSRSNPLPNPRKESDLVNNESFYQSSCCTVCQACVHSIYTNTPSSFMYDFELCVCRTVCIYFLQGESPFCFSRIIHFFKMLRFFSVCFFSLQGLNFNVLCSGRVIDLYM